MTLSTDKRRLLMVTGLTGLAIIFLASFVLEHFRKDPNVLFLTDKAGAQWIKFDREFELKAFQAGQKNVTFKHHFKTTSTIDSAHFFVRALRHCQVFLDGEFLCTLKFDDNWKKACKITISSPLRPGAHELIVVVASFDTPPVLWVYSDTLPVKTGPLWHASIQDDFWTPAVSVSRIKPVELSRKFPSSPRALQIIMPYLVPIFIFVFCWSMLFKNPANLLPKLNQWQPKPCNIRWALLIFWTVMAVNNIFKLHFRIGLDLSGHLRYISYIVINRSLPLANEGWQMFQSPLYYIISAPFCALFKNFFDASTTAKLLRIIPLICGLVQIEIIYRVAKLVFPKRNDLQIIATVVGSLIPMHIYICQFVGNEPLAGCLTSWLVLLVLSLLTSQQTKHNFSFFILIGLVWGLALLSKVTAVLLVLPLISVIIVHNRNLGKSVGNAVVNIATVFGACFITAGWYFIRNFLEIGKPFVGGWDPSRGVNWWQDPGYRTFSQIFSFGESLIYPVFSGIMSFADALYSTFWLDGFNSGKITFIYRPPWNINFMIAGALLAVIPSILLLAGVAAPFRKAMSKSRNAVLFSILCVVIYFVAILHLYIKLPIFSTAKATYTLGLLPCYGIIAAAGAEPLLRNRFVRSLLLASLTCWAVAAYLAYFVYHFSELP